MSIELLAVEYATATGPVRAVDGVSLAVHAGEVVGLVGESGSGKSTLAAAVLGLVKPPGRIVAGTVRLAGQDLQALPAAALRRVRGGRIGLLPQNAMNALNPVIPVLDQVAEAVLVHQPVSRQVARQRARALLELVGIAFDWVRDYPHELSGGQRQRVILAMALANDPWLLVADEPTTGLDVLAQAEIVALLSTIQQRLGLALLLISHDLGVVLGLADELAIVQRGQLVEKGSAREVAARPAHACTRRLLEAAHRLQPAPRARPTVGAGEPALLRLEDVRKAYPARRRRGRRIVLDQVCLTVAPGEIVGLVGGSGAGKSTLARLVAGLERPDGGRILIEGVDRASVSGPVRRALRGRVHLVFQDPYDALPPHLRVREVVGEPLAILGVGGGDERVERVRTALEEVGLAPPASFLERYPHQLSGGERQRVALARALVLRPRLLVADEPTSMLDVTLRAELLDLMRRLRDRHALAYLFITHDLALASSFCDRLVVLCEGRVVEEGPTGDILARPCHPYTAALLRAARALAPLPAPAPSLAST